MNYIAHLKTTTVYGNTIEHKVTESGTAYHEDTEDKVVDVLENAKKEHFRIRVVYGDRETGKVWNEENDIMGYVGRSSGNIKIPILVHNARSMGGGALLDNCILGIMDTEEKQWIYKAENINFGEHKIEKIGVDWCLVINGYRQAMFETEEKAKRFSDFLLCKRNSK